MQLFLGDGKAMSGEPVFFIFIFCMDMLYSPFRVLADAIWRWRVAGKQCMAMDVFFYIRHGTAKVQRCQRARRGYVALPCVKGHYYNRKAPRQFAACRSSAVSPDVADAAASAGGVSPAGGAGRPRVVGNGYCVVW